MILHRDQAYKLFKMLSLMQSAVAYPVFTLTSWHKSSPATTTPTQHPAADLDSGCQQSWLQAICTQTGGFPGQMAGCLRETNQQLIALSL